MTNGLNILVADDQAQFVADFVATAFSANDKVVIDTAATPNAVLAKIAAKPYDMVLLDISFTPGNREGLDLLPEIRLINPECPIVMLSSFDDRVTIKRAMDLGATNYVVKSLERDLDTTVQYVRSAIAKRRFAELAVAEGRVLAQNAGAIFQSVRSNEVLAKIARARRATNTNILITGPTGAGKDAVARSIARFDQGAPFVAINCASLTPSLVESELFGYVKGAFTGAAKDTSGLFDAANGGDIFLDEVACLSPKAQAALLRVLQSGEFNPVGSSTTKTVKVRVIAATNEDLNLAVKSGEFREDLLARLRQGFEITVPALKERREDIWPIIQQTIAHSHRPDTKISPACREFLESYSWPTNIRGLIGTINQMLALTEEPILDVSDIPKDILSGVEYEHGYSKIHTESKIEVNTELLRVEIPESLSLEKANVLFLVRFIEKKIVSLPHPRTVSALAVALAVPRTTLIRRLRELDLDFDSIAANRQHTGEG